MAVLILASDPGQANYDFESELEGQTYGFAMRENRRDGRMYLDIADSEGAELLSGRILVSNFPLTRTTQLQAMPPGEFIVYEPTAGTDATVDTLGDGVDFAYTESS